MAERNIHISRTIDMMFGAYIKDKNAPIQNITKDFQKLVDEVSSAGNRYREILTKNTPAIYIVDCVDIAKILKAELSVNKTTTKFGKISEIEASLGGETRILEFVRPDGIDTITSIVSDPSFETELANFLYNSFFSGGRVIKKSTTTVQGFFGVTVNTTFEPSGSYKPIAEDTLSDLYSKVSKLYVKYRGNVAAEMRGGRNYAKIQAQGVKLGKDLYDSLRTINNFIAKDGSKYIQLPSNKSIVVCGNSFDSVVASVNRVLDNAFRYFLYEKNKEAIQYLKSLDDTSESDKKYFSIGFLINAGHTSATILTSKGKQSLGVNMPSAQQAQILLPKEISAELETELTELYADIGYEVNFTKNIRNVKALLELNFAFVITMPSALNTKGLNNAERAIVRKYREDLQKSLQTFVKNKDLQKIAAEYLPISNASPTLIDSIRINILSILKGESSSSVVDKYRNKSVISTKTPNLKKIQSAKISAPNRKSIGKKRVSNNVPKVAISNIPALTQNLTSLQSLLDSLLVERVKQNMGSGNSKDILNLRSGRFAESVKVERLSESRAGMITAFYSYMKNPYATFSEGGRQQTPRSRDPKLLISKSIREIAQQQVANRLRAVNI